ncbi:MAG: Sensor histidine kinase RcsC [Paraeggerthella hongkongensis]
MGKREDRQSKTFDRLLDSSGVFAVVALILVAFLVGFYVVLSINMNEIDQRTERLKDHPYAVTLAAGRAETYLMSMRTLDDRLGFARTPETVESVRVEFEEIDQQMIKELEQVSDRFIAAPELAVELSNRYEEFRLQQQELIDMSLGDASDHDVARFLSDNIDPRINHMLTINTEIIDVASESFDRTYAQIADARKEAIDTATVLLSVFVVALILFIIVIMRKNNQQRALQKSLSCALEAAQEANEAKSRFLSNVSHDIRTPLTAIIGLANIASEHEDDRERVGESINKIKLSSHHLLNLVNDVLDMSKIESGQIDLTRATFNVCNLVEMMVSIVRPQADTKQLSFEAVNCSLGRTLVVGDEMRVSQILVNLLGNAVKYTEPGGHVWFSAARMPFGEVAEELNLNEQDAQKTCVVRFVIEDDGIGMSSDFVERMFDPFEREERPSRLAVEGTGLGMSIVKNLIDVMNGSIKVESVQGKGSKFTVDLPFEMQEEASADAEDLSTAPDDAELPDGGRSADWARVRVLLVEDNDIVGEIAEEFIKSTGASVDRAWDGLEAVETLRSAPENYYDLVFMDIQMPRMDGLEAARAIVEESSCAHRSHPPIIAMTANAYVEDRKRASEAGMDGYAVKPIGKDEIVRLLETHVKPRSAR